ncbi:MAG: CotH kinase family protein [Candidatus Omnitrophota bacterium]
MNRIRLPFYAFTAVFAFLPFFPGGVCAKSSADYTYVYENERILSFTIEMTEESFQKMQPKRKAPEMGNMSSRSMFAQEFEYVPATVICDGAVYQEVGVRYRGNASIVIIPPDGKKPLKLDFDRFDDDQVFHGFTKLNFINGFRDPSLLRDKLAYDLYRKAGVPAPHASFANVYLAVGSKPKEHLGFFVVIEQVNRPFLEDRFGNSNGLLVKFEIMKDLEYRGEEWEKYAADHELNSNDPADTKHLIQFLKFLTQSSDEEFAKKIDSKLNVDKFLAWLAINTLLTDLDSYAGLGHNWYLYYNADSKRFEFIPWDVNESFGNLQVATPDKMLNFDINKPYMGDKILIQRILNIEKYKELYLFYLKTFVRDFFNPAFMHKEIERLHSFIDASVKADANPVYSYEDFQKTLDENVKPHFFLFSQEIIGLKPFVTQRCESVLAQLSGEKKGDVIDSFMLGVPGEPPSSEREGNIAPPPMAPGGDVMIPMPTPAPMTEEKRQKIQKLKAELKEKNLQIQNNPNNSELYVQKGEILGKLTELVDPIEQMTYGIELGAVFEKAVELDPNSLGGHFGRGAVRFFTPEPFGGSLEGAASDFQFVLSKDPKNEQANFFMALVYQRKNEKDKAAEHLQKVIEINPNHQQAKELLKAIQP